MSNVCGLDGFFLQKVIRKLFNIVRLGLNIKVNKFQCFASGVMGWTPAQLKARLGLVTQWVSNTVTHFLLIRSWRNLKHDICTRVYSITYARVRIVYDK